ncbi:glycosyl hydrolase [Ancylobacter sp. Lp-2]|uniref:glycosyl hydrolase n=1 Tax=Ancylobacter sp. Lp-2 TaxID=2881339 RepID=UPI001E4AF8F5|nr:glycosyl hydrolase [Ancylobacter sp. Lp-2]MCB4771379.1 glycosyl hydrolase [Ancylobacter sp. Lp-2]
MAAPVSVSGTQVVVDGKAFAIRGAAGEQQLGELAGLGATTVRTYGGDPGPVLDAAQQAGLKVIVGLWVEHPRRGVDYADRAFVDKQLADFSQTVEKYKDHPALLMWGIGNEVESELADDGAVWPAIEEVAAMVKAADPAHPRIAVLAETGADKVAKLRVAAPSIDVLGINAYGDALYSVVARARDQGWTGPIVITELGARGQWQAATAPWGAPFELTSTQKAIELRRYIAALDKQGVGIILFFWGWKQEVTPSWHSLRLPSGEWTEAAESMAEAWGGRTPEGNHAPRIAALRLVANPSQPYASVGASEPWQVELAASDPDGDRLDIRWVVRQESRIRTVAGDFEPDAEVMADAVVATENGARVRALPVGKYRLFVEIRDGRGAAATANLPFEVR